MHSYQEFLVIPTSDGSSILKTNMSKSLFQKIAEKEIPAKIIYEDETGVVVS
jgi:23S rRNA-/tRNA-specific pseudouridylate synthase